jgi:hypothetical protein
MFFLGESGYGLDFDLLGIWYYPSSQNDCPTSRIFCPKIIGWFICLARNFRLKVRHFCAKLLIKKSFDIATSGGISKWLLFIILRVILTTTRSMVNGP